MTTEAPTTTTTYDPTVRLATLFGTEVLITATSGNEISVVVPDEAPMLLNRIPVAFRIYFKRTDNGHWQSQHMFINRLDFPGQPRYAQRKATDNQTSKLYTAVRELAETLPETFLLAGEVYAQQREVKTANQAVDKANEELQAKEDALAAAKEVLWNAEDAIEQAQS